MANPRRSVRSLSISWSRQTVFLLLLLLLSVFVVYHAVYQLQVIFHSSKSLDHEADDDTELQNATVVFNLHSKYPATVPSTERRLRTLLERDLKRLEAKAATISSAKRAALGLKKPSVLFSGHGNVYPDGLYYTEVYIGRPAKVFFMDMDTGSELTWLQCDAPCLSCGHGPNGLYDLSNVQVINCRSEICAKMQEGRSFECKEELEGQWTQCDYEVDYADGSFTKGALVLDFFTLFLSNGRKRGTEAVLGCGYDQRGHVAKDPILTDGVMGLSNSVASLPSQLAQKAIVKKVIGQCLGNNGGGHLFFGEALVPMSGMMWVPMVGNLRKFGHYQARLQGILHGTEKLSVNGAVSEMTFDSGASYTYFVSILYDAVLSAVLDQAMRLHLVRELLDNAMPYCWSINTVFQVSSLPDIIQQYFKVISLDFGRKNVLELRPENYLIISKARNVCLGILNSKDTGLKFVNIIDISMQGYLIVYNNVRNELGWIRKDCNKQTNQS